MARPTKVLPGKEAVVIPPAIPGGKAIVILPTPEAVIESLKALVSVSHVCSRLKISVYELMAYCRDNPAVADMVDRCNRAQTLIQIGRLNDHANGLIQLTRDEKETMFRMVYRGDRLAGIGTEAPGDLPKQPITITQVFIGVQSPEPKPFRQIVEKRENETQN